MSCLYPNVSPVTAYKKGCRCSVCRSGRRQILRECAGKPWAERSPGIRKRYPVPAEPILKLLENWLQERKSDVSEPYESLGMELGIKESGAARMIYRLRNKETTYMSLAQADKIISALFGPHYWYENEELLAIYEEHA